MSKLERKCQRQQEQAARWIDSVTVPAGFAARLFEQIQAEVSARMEAIASQSRREAAAFADALAGMLAGSQIASREGLDELAAGRQEAHDGCVALRAEAEQGRAAIHDVFATVQTVADDLEARARDHAEEIGARCDALLREFEKKMQDQLADARIRVTTRVSTEIDRATADATDRLDESRRAIDEQVGRLREQVARHRALVAAEAERVVAPRELAEPGPVEGPDDATAEDPIWHDLARATLTGDDAADVAHDDEYFFSRLAAELRAEDDLPSGTDGYPTGELAATPGIPVDAYAPDPHRRSEPARD